MDIPVWVYFVLAGIIISAIMAIKTGREDRELEMENIEKEGEVYLKRIEQAKETKEEIKSELLEEEQKASAGE